MKNLLFISLILFTGSVFGQSNIKVKFKKGNILVDRLLWGKYEEVNGKTLIYTLDNTNCITISEERVLNKEKSDFGLKVTDNVITVHFILTDIAPFEMVIDKDDFIRKLVSNGVIENDEFNSEKALAFKEKYAGKP